MTTVADVAWGAGRGSPLEQISRDSARQLVRELVARCRLQRQVPAALYPARAVV